ncbi:lipopolysaccharide biosynthesis protein [Bdellovibrio bacteriovorus]|uniref:lipopolysaccharide biosynthesis protein n=1 Tax=Bdellovibrio bacteriovorus TaxID=959 RepID=UPI003AA9CB6B
MKKTIGSWLQSKFFGSEFVRSVGVLAGGTAASQLIGVLALPFITRLYTPGDFSVLAVYVSVVTILSVPACLRLDFAIPLPEDDNEAFSLLAASLIMSVLSALVVGVGVFLLNDFLGGHITNKGILKYLWLVPIGVWTMSSYSALQYWMGRQKAFRSIAQGRAVQMSSSVGVQFLLAGSLFKEMGLLLGYLANSMVGCVYLGSRLAGEIRHHAHFVSVSSMRIVISKFKAFPKYSTWESLANSAAIELPMVIIASVTVGAEAGYLMLASRVMAMPMGLIGSSVAQVFLSSAPNEMRQNRLSDFTRRTLVGLGKAGVGPLLFVGIVAPAVFGHVFGASWEKAGVLIAWMTPWFVLQFLVSPVSTSFHVLGQVRLAMLIQFFGLVLRLGMIFGAHYFVPTYVAESYALSGAIFYFVYFSVSCSICKVSQVELWKILLFKSPIIFAWGLLGVLVWIVSHLIW